MISFNGVDIPSFVKVRAVNVSALPSLNPNLKGNMAGFGVLAGKTTFNEAYISIAFSIVIPSGYTLQKCSRELAIWLKGNDFDLSPLIIKDDASIRYMAKVSSSVDISDLIFAGEGEIKFVIPSGVGEAVVEKISSATNKATITYSGSQKTFPIIEITLGANASAVTITHIQKGVSIFLNGTFILGDKIYIDCNKHLVKVNNQLHMEMIGVTSKFIQLDGGLNEISCSNTGSSVKVTYREKYLI